MEGQGVLVNLDISTFGVRHQHTVLPDQFSPSIVIKAKHTALRSVAKFNFFISAAASAKFSVLPLALNEVRGVEPPAVEGAGVDTDDPDFPFSAFLAAFSASRFCFDAEGAIL